MLLRYLDFLKENSSLTSLIEVIEFDIGDFKQYLADLNIELKLTRTTTNAGDSNILPDKYHRIIYHFKVEFDKDEHSVEELTQRRHFEPLNRIYITRQTNI